MVGVQAAIPLPAPSIVRPAMATSSVSVTRITAAIAAPDARLVVSAVIGDGMTTAPLSPLIRRGFVMVTCSSYVPEHTRIRAPGRAASTAP